MNYTEAIEWLREHDVKKDDGSYYEFGEVTTKHNIHTHPSENLTNIIIKVSYCEHTMTVHTFVCSDRVPLTSWQQ